MTFIDLVYHLVKMTYNKHMAKRDDDLEFSLNAPFDDGRAVIDKVPLYLVNGSLGAGKTSVLEFLLQQSDYKGSRVIENEYANETLTVIDWRSWRIL